MHTFDMLSRATLTHSLCLLLTLSSTVTTSLLSSTNASVFPAISAIPSCESLTAWHEKFRARKLSQKYVRARQGWNAAVDATTFTVCIDTLAHDLRACLGAASWVNTPPDFAGPIDTIVQKIIIPKESTVYVIGGLHGNCAGLCAFMTHLQKLSVMDKQNGFYINTKAPPNTYFIFLGNYSGEIFDDIDTIYTLLQLKKANPDHIILLRGPMEELYEHHGPNTVSAQLKQTPLGQKLIKKLYDIFSLMPSAVYLGTKINGVTSYQLFCAGAPEPGYDARQLLQNPATSTFQFFNCDGALHKKRAERATTIGLVSQKNIAHALSSFRWGTVAQASNTSPSIEPIPGHYTKKGFLLPTNSIEALITLERTPECNIESLVCDSEKFINTPTIKMLPVNRTIDNDFIYALCTPPRTSNASWALHKQTIPKTKIRKHHRLD